MNCEDLIQLLSEGKELGPAARAHAAGCPGCGPMLAALETPGPAPSTEHLARLGSVLSAGAKRVRPLPSNGTLLTIGIVTFLAFSLLVAAATKMKALTVLSSRQELWYFVPLLLLAVLFARTLVEQIIPGARRRMPAALPAVAAFVVTAAVATLLFAGEGAGPFVQQGIPCLRLGTISGILAGALGWLLMRRGYLTTPLQTIALYGFFAGFAGVMVLALHCSILESPHILVWHLGAMLLTGIGGFTVGKIFAERL